MHEKRILIIDPDIKFRKRATAFLKNEGFTVECGKCLTEAIQKMVKTGFHCVVMDVKLPETKGYKAVPILKNIDPDLKIIMTTSKNSMKLESKVRNQDIFYYFIKSFGLDELKAAINSLFAQKSDQDSNTDVEHYKGKILVIDDDADFIDMVSMILQTASYKVITARNPIEGGHKLCTENPDLVLLDIMMDSLSDGYSLCHAIKTSEEFKMHRTVPIIFVSAVKDPVHSHLSFTAGTKGYVGPDDYVDKPVQPKLLINRIENLIKKKDTK